MPERTLPVVQTAGLCKTFKDFWRRPRVEAVKDLDLEIQPGEVFGLLGPNGSGKTTAIKMLLGLLYPTRGRISVFGKPPTDVGVKSRIGFLPEESYLYRFLVAHETLDFFGQLFRIPARIRRERIERLLDMVGLRQEAKRRVGEYSKGMARRIGLAQALINDPEFLILDEPTSGLDPIGTRQIKDVIKELGRKGKTILLSSHILADVEDVCDRVMILYGGQQRALGDIGELLRKRDVTQITAPALSEETVAKLRDLIFRLEKKNTVSVSNPRVKLEDFFLRIVEEAQAANIRTSGARAGGAMPDFLAKPTEVTTHQVVESLVQAADRPVQVITATESERAQARGSGAQGAKEAREVLERLVSGPEQAEATQEEQEQEEEQEPVDFPPEPQQPRQAPVADAGVISSLVDRARGESDADESEKG